MEYILQLIVALAAVIDAGQGYGYGGYGFRSYRYGKRETVTMDYYAVEKRKAELAAIAAFGGVALRCNGFWWLQSRLPSLATGTRTLRLPC